VEPAVGIATECNDGKGAFMVDGAPASDPEVIDPRATVDLS
jgi:hypothetical protein